MNKKIYLKKVYWQNIYLHLLLEGNNFAKYEFYITDLTEKKYPLIIKDNEIIINIVNFPDIKLLNTGKWYILFRTSTYEDFVCIDKKVGYEFEHLDKIFKYGRNKYSYLINFKVVDYDEVKFRIKNTTDTTYAMTFCLEIAYMMLNKKETKRNIFVESSNIVQVILKLSIILCQKMMQLIYQILCFFRRKDGKHILMMSETRTPISGNLKALDMRMKERHLNEIYKISYSFSITLQQNKFKTLIDWLRLLWVLPKQDYVFVDDYVPIFKFITLDSKTKFIQLWHAGVGFKSVGYSRFGKEGSPHPMESCHRKYTHVVVGSSDLIPVYEEVFGVDQKNFYPYGLPRLDGYLDKIKIENFKKEFYENYPFLKGKKIILFAPTYRGSSQKDAFYPLEKINHKKILELKDKDFVFIYKMHPFINQEINIEKEYEDVIFNFSNFNDINSLFYITDILITDYSSNVYEYSLLKKPIIFYVYDRDFYQLTRGVHRSIEEVSETVCETFDEVIDTIKNGNYKVKNSHVYVHDVYASDRIIDNIILNSNDK